MAKPLTSWLVPSFSQHNLRLVVRNFETLFARFSDEVSREIYKFTGSKQRRKVSNMLYRHVFDKISTEFRGSAMARNIRSPNYDLRHLHFTNWRLEICIWRLYFSSWSPKGDLTIFLISSPVCRVYCVTVKTKNSSNAKTFIGAKKAHQSSARRRHVKDQKICLQAII